MLGLEPTVMLEVFAIMLLAATVRGTLGFGDALLALPLLALLLILLFQVMRRRIPNVT